MVRRKDRTRKVVKEWVRTPGGRLVLHVYRKKAKGKAKCALCKSELHGVSMEGAKSQKRVTRIFGGHLCHKCTERLITLATRVKEGTIKMDDVPISMREFVDVLVKNL